VSPRGKALAVRPYAALTRLLPGELGRRYAQEAAPVFDELHRDAVRERSRRVRIAEVLDSYSSAQWTNPSFRRSTSA